MGARGTEIHRIIHGEQKTTKKRSGVWRSQEDRKVKR